MILAIALIDIISPELPGEDECYARSWQAVQRAPPVCTLWLN